MKEKRRKRELTVKQVKTIAFIISIAFFLAIVINDIFYQAKGISTSNVYERIFGYILFLMLAILIYVFICILLGSEEKIRREENHKVKAEIKEKMLSTTEFKKVSLQIEDPEIPKEMLMDILEEEGCEFYAKFDDKNDEIIIICINKQGKKIYEDTINDGLYFKKIFKVS